MRRGSPVKESGQWIGPRQEIDIAYKMSKIVSKTILIDPFSFKTTFKWLPGVHKITALTRESL